MRVFWLPINPIVKRFKNRNIEKIPNAGLIKEMIRYGMRLAKSKVKLNLEGFDDLFVHNSRATKLRKTIVTEPARRSRPLRLPVTTSPVGAVMA